MERVTILINRLTEQLQQQAPADNLLVTAQMLVAQLQQKHVLTCSSKVAITMPVFHHHLYAETVDNTGILPIEASTFLTDNLVLQQPVENAETIDSIEILEIETPILIVDDLILPQPIETDTFIAEEEIVAKEEDVVFKQNHFFGNAFTALPTFAFNNEQKEVFVLNDTMVVEAENNNTKWNENRVEVATVLERTPIKDFKKAININDRYLFINELFRGDEAMYERSLKTIQGFSILPEATFWIQRELKLKLGWTEGTQAVKLFDQLVCRRFC